MTEKPKYAHLLKDIAAEWHKDLVTFLETGDASPAFTDFMNRDKACQKVVDEAINEEGAAFERLASALGEAQSPSDTVSANIAMALEEALALPEEQRVAALGKAAKALKLAAGTRKSELATAVRELEQKVAQ